MIKNDIDPDSVRKLGLQSLIPTPRSSESSNKNKLNISEHTWSNINPNERQVKLMLALVGEIITDFIMSNHTYRVDDDMFLQEEGGPIGLDFARVVSRLAMILLDRILNISYNKCDSFQKDTMTVTLRSSVKKDANDNTTTTKEDDTDTTDAKKEYPPKRDKTQLIVFIGL